MWRCTDCGLLALHIGARAAPDSRTQAACVVDAKGMCMYHEANTYAL